MGSRLEPNVIIVGSGAYWLGSTIVGMDELQRGVVVVQHQVMQEVTSLPIVAREPLVECAITATGHVPSNRNKRRAEQRKDQKNKFRKK